MKRSGSASAPLSPAEKAELQRLAASEALRRDLRILGRPGSRLADFDEYLRFATMVARLSNHARRPFRPIVGASMKL